MVSKWKFYSDDVATLIGALAFAGYSLLGIACARELPRIECRMIVHSMVGLKLLLTDHAKFLIIGPNVFSRRASEHANFRTRLRDSRYGSCAR